MINNLLEQNKISNVTYGKYHNKRHEVSNSSDTIMWALFTYKLLFWELVLYYYSLMLLSWENLKNKQEKK